MSARFLFLPVNGIFNNIYIGLFIWGVCLGLGSCANADERACETMSFKGGSYTVCQYNMRRVDIRTFLQGQDGVPIATFSKLQAHIKADGRHLLFAMNGGMYHDDRSAVGLYIENGKLLQKLNINKGPGNFHMLPNGVFYVGDQIAGVLESRAFQKQNLKPLFATQSGPMLVIDGRLHPKFNQSGTSVHIRNGVGVKGETVYFVISNEKVNFYDFASLFKDNLKTPNALYLDGTVSKIYAPEIKRKDTGRAMGPIIAVVEAKK